MPHCKNTQTIREIAKCFEKNTEKAMNDIANISHYVGSKLSALCQPGCKDMFYELQKSPVIDWRSLLSVIMEIANYFDTDTDTIFDKCINDNEKFNKFINTLSKSLRRVCIP